MTHSAVFATRSRAALAAITSALMIVAFALVGITPSAQASVGGTVTGTVTSASGGPLSGINVDAWDGSTSASAVTDADGHYVITGLSAGVYSVGTNDYTLAYWSASQPEVTVLAEAQTVADFTLEPRPNYVLRGHVTNAVTGDAVPDLLVSVWAPSAPSVSGLSATTDANGFYEITHIPVATVSLSTADDSEQFTFWRLDNVAVGTEPTVHDIALELKPTGSGSISGVVRERATDAPIEGANVTARTADGYFRSVTTASGGAYSFVGVPLSTVTIQVSGPTSGPVYLSNSASVVLTEAAPSRQRDVLLKVAPVGTSVVSGTITESDGAGGSLPLADFWVSASTSDMSSGGAMSVKTDASGQFSIANLAKGAYFLSIMPYDVTQAGDFKPTDYRTLAFTVDGVNPVTKNVQLVRYPTGVGSVAGTLTDRRTDAPIGNASVSIGLADGSLSKIATTDTRGQWAIANLPDGEYELGITSFEHEFQWTWPRFTISDGGHVDLVSSLTSVPVGTASLSGRVKDFATHEGVPDATVQIDREEGGYQTQSARADANGDYLIADLPEGRYRVTVSADSFGQSTGAVDIAEAEAATFNASLVALPPVPSGEGTVTGTVTDAEGYPVSGAYVYAGAEFAASAGPGGWASTMTDADGQFELDALPLTTLTVSISALSFASASDSVTLTVGSPDTVLDFRIEEAASLSGIVSAADGVPLSGVQVMAYTADGTPLWGGQVNELTGEYVIDGLAPGDYIIRVFQASGLADASGTTSLAGAYWKSGSLAGTQDGASATVVHLTAGERSFAHDVELGAGGTIAGTVRVSTTDGTAVLPQGKSVRVLAHKLIAGSWVPQEFAYTFAYFGNDGAYELVGLSAGSYKLEFRDVWEGNRAYSLVYNGGAAAIADAPVIVVAAGETAAGVDVSVSAPIPVSPSTAVPTSGLAATGQGQVGAPSGATTGEEITINVGAELAGEFVSVWAHSDPTPLSGWVKVASDGTVKAVIGSSLPAGQHHLVVQDADDAVVGWSQLAVTPVTSPGSGGGSGSTPSTPGSSTPGSGAPGAAAPGTRAPSKTQPKAATETDGAIDVVPEGLEQPADDTDEPAVVEKSAPDDNAAAESSAGDTADAGLNWTLLFGLLAGVLVIGAVGAVVATVRSRRN